MSETPAAPPTSGGQITIPADLPVAQARDLHQVLLAALAAARDGGEPVVLDLDSPEARPCALQLLAAAERSAMQSGVELALGANAASARIPLHASETTEQTDR